MHKNNDSQDCCNSIYKSVFEQSGDAIVLIRDSKLVSANQASLSLLAISDASELIDAPISVLSPPLQPDGLSSRTKYAEVLKQISLHGKHRCQWLLSTGDSKHLLVEVTFSAIKQAGADYVLAIFDGKVDNTSIKQQHYLNSLVIHHISEAVLICNSDNQIQYANPAFYRTTGFEPARTLGRNTRFLHTRHHKADFYRAIADTLARDAFWRGEVWANKANGTTFPINLTITAVTGDKPEQQYFISVFSDSTREHQKESELKKLAYYDSLTSLPNRGFFKELLAQETKRSKRKEAQFSLLFIDLDDFKGVNDTLGHSIGDVLLSEFAKRLKACTRESDVCARMGGDEFMVILPNVRDSLTAERVATNLVRYLKEPLNIDGQHIRMAASIGISSYPKDGTTSEELIRVSDLAMYQAKKISGTCFRFYSELDNARQMEIYEIENEIRQGLIDREFVAHYQVKVDMKSLRPVGFEALARWNHPVRGLVSPADFIDIAEKADLIKEISGQIISQVALDVKSYIEIFGKCPPVAINISSSQFRDLNFPNYLANTLRSYELDPESIDIEITESMMIEADDAMASLNQLKSIGIKIAIDDFGTGYSSLSYLKRLPADYLKIDKLFVDDIAFDLEYQAIVKAIIQLADGLKLTVVAEGVENQEQLECLRDLGCHHAQGYLFGRPEPLDEAMYNDLIVFADLDEA